MDETQLDELTEIAQEIRDLAEYRDDLILSAWQDGFSLRRIAEAVEMSHTTVARVVNSS